MPPPPTQEAAPAVAASAPAAPAVVNPGEAATPEQAYAVKPVNITFQITEIRPGSKFFAGLADLFNTAKPALETSVEQALLPDQRQKAASDQMTASATALSTLSSALNTAETQRQNYCAASSMTANWLSLSAALRADQLSADVAAAAAHQPMPFAQPIPVSKVKVTSVCPA